MRNQLVPMSVFLGNTYTRRSGRSLDQIIRAIDKLRCRLDSVVFRDYPGGTHLARIYYPGADARMEITVEKLEDICRALTAWGTDMGGIAALLLTHLPVTVGDSALKIARTLTYEAGELPFRVQKKTRQRPRVTG